MLNKLRYILRMRNSRYMEKYDVTLEQMENMVSKGAVLVDVRSPQEYVEGHLDNSILIPEYELKSSALNMLPNKDETIIVYCSSGTRSKKAQRKLEKMGYKNVYNVYNGIQNFNLDVL